MTKTNRDFGCLSPGACINVSMSYDTRLVSKYIWGQKMAKCKDCGKEHEMCLQNKANNSWIYIDWCKDCLYANQYVYENKALPKIYSDWGEELRKNEDDIIEKMDTNTP